MSTLHKSAAELLPLVLAADPSSGQLLSRMLQRLTCNGHGGASRVVVVWDVLSVGTSPTTLGHITSVCGFATCSVEQPNPRTQHNDARLLA